MNATTLPKPADARRIAIIELLEKNAGVLATYLPRRELRERFIALARRTLIDKPELWACDKGTVMRALSAAAASGLPIDGKMSSLVVRKAKDGPPTCVWDPTYRGMVYLALESGHVASVEAHAVHARDEFDFELGTSPRIKHKPWLAEDRGPVIAAYAYAVLTSGAIVREVLGRVDLERVRNASPMPDKGPWLTDPDTMSMKSAMRKLLKRLPAADIGSIGKAINHVTEHDDDPGSFVARVGAPPPPEPPDTAGLEARAFEAIAEATSVERLAAMWVGVLAEFKAAKAELPIALEAQYNDRREALQQ